MSHAGITQSFENSQKLVFGRTLVAHIGMKGWVGRVGPVPALLSDLRSLVSSEPPSLLTPSTMLRDDLCKTPFFANKV